MTDEIVVLSERKGLPGGTHMLVADKMFPGCVIFMLSAFNRLLFYFLF